MFSKLIFRNSKRDRRENGLFFSSLLVSIIAFYIILSLSHQDVMLFLAKMESDAVQKLLKLIPVFYGMTLFILFFLIYYASKFQLERRRHEFGVYLMMGMQRSRLFIMLLGEDLRNSVVSLSVGLPVAVLLSELVSLVTARLVGLGIINHQSTFSPQAALWTAAGFLLIKSAAFLLLSGKISRQEIASLLVTAPDGEKKQRPMLLYMLSALFGALCLAFAYHMAARPRIWGDVRMMGLTLMTGLFGTFILFWGLRFPMDLIVRIRKSDRRLHVFNYRQIQETVIHRSGALAVCSLLILAALCCFGAGVAISRFYGGSAQHVLDYTFLRDSRYGNDTAAIRQVLNDHGLDDRFAELFEMRVGHIRTEQGSHGDFQMEDLMTALNEMDPSQTRDVLLNNFSYMSYPYLISLDSYNRLLTAAGLPTLELETGEAAVYMDDDFTFGESIQILNEILRTEPDVSLNGDLCRLTGSVQTTNLVTDRSIALSFALILPDEAFLYYTQGDWEVYLNGILAETTTKNTSLLSAISDMNEELTNAGLSYESYLQNIGRQLFYMVAASYITIYLAIIFLIIANTVIGASFLMSQQKTGRRYRTLIHLGAAYKILCRSAHDQINWYFGIPIAVAALSSLFGVRALFTGLLPSSAKGTIHEMMIVSAAMIFALCMVECIYISVVKRSSDRYLLTLMVPEREE